MSLRVRQMEGFPNNGMVVDRFGNFYGCHCACGRTTTVPSTSLRLKAAQRRRSRKVIGGSGELSRCRDRITCSLILKIWSCNLV